MSLIFRTISSCAVVVIIALSATGQERRPDPVGDLTGRDAVGFRKDSKTKETVGDRRAPANTPTTKQAIEDFMQIQKVNRQIQDMAQQKPMALEGIAAAAKDLSKTAQRLKTSLSLPAPPKDAVKTGIALPASTDELLNQVKELDTSIKAFVTNPIFRQLTDTSRDLPKEASVSLSNVITLSKVLEGGARRLRQ